MANIARISKRSRQIAEEIGRATGDRQIDIIEQALLAYRRHWRLEQLSRDFEQLKGDQERWDSYREETQELEGTLGDGLKDED